jgi:hypothetical protein
MRKRYPLKNLLLVSIAILLFAIASCKTDNNNTNTNMKTTPPVATPKKLGLYEADSGIYKLLFMEVSQIGTQPINFDLVFDTGSGGLVIDADSIISQSMITSNGFNFTGDSTVVDGITITNQTAVVEYGDDDASIDKVYGNLCYAPVTLGDDVNGDVIIKRLPFFMYYKAVDAKGNLFPPHEFDVLGVSSEYDISFHNGTYITSPLGFYDPGNGLTKGFKMAALGTSNFTYVGYLIPNVVTLGLTAADLSSSSGFAFSTLPYSSEGGYDPLIPTTLTYNGVADTTEMLFDTGTDPYSYIEDPNAISTLSLLPSNSTVSLKTNTGFTFDYTTTNNDYLTYIENPNTSGAEFSIEGLEFFLNNEYLLDYTDHKLGLKNN